MGKTILLHKDVNLNEAALSEAAEVIRRGGVIAVPTDTVYGFAAAVTNEAAIARLYEIKERSQTKSIAVLLGDADQAHLVADDFPERAARMAAAYWPGALTLIVRKKAGLPKDLSSNELVGIRIPDHDVLRELIRRTGPLATTSANLSGMPPAKSVEEFAPALGDRLDLILDDGPAAGGVPSTVVNCSLEPPVILREGAIPGADLLNC